MISNNLLKEVTGLKVVTGSHLFDNNVLRIFISDKCDCVDTNIYKLAFKYCKEWARDNSYEVLSTITFGNQGYSEVHSEFHQANENFIAKTEYESILKACEWILEKLQKDSK